MVEAIVAAVMLPAHAPNLRAITIILPAVIAGNRVLPLLTYGGCRVYS